VILGFQPVKPQHSAGPEGIYRKMQRAILRIFITWTYIATVDYDVPYAQKIVPERESLGYSHTDTEV